MSKQESSPLLTVLKGLGIAGLLLLPFACGIVEFPDSTGKIIRRGYNDHPGKKVKRPHVLDEHFEEVPYDPAIHGEPVEFIAEGERVYKYPTHEGEAHFHRHPNNDEGIPVVAYGPLELTTEKI